jgi:hypothetical protein
VHCLTFNDIANDALPAVVANASLQTVTHGIDDEIATLSGVTPLLIYYKLELKSGCDIFLPLSQV